MNKELELKLVEKYPVILKDYGGDMKQTCMHWGMECGDGWYDLIDELLGKLDLISKNMGVQVTAAQIKQKFGTLRFYYDTVITNDLNVDMCVEDIIRDVVSTTESRSAQICEKTGKGGTLCSRVGWLKTLCKDEADTEGFTPVNPELAKYWDETDNEQLSNKENI